MKTYQHIDWQLLKKFRQSRTNDKTGRPFNQQDIADAIGKKQSYVSRLEKGDYVSPDDKVVNALAAAFKMKPSIFLGHIERRDGETNFIKDAKITYSSEPLPIPKYTQNYNARGMAYEDAILFDNPDYVDRPPFLKNVTGAYAVVMPSYEMEPRYRQGDTLYVNPEILPERGDDVVIHLKFKHHTVCIIREAIFAENAAADDEEEVPSYGCLSLADKQVIIQEASQAKSEEAIKDGGTMFNLFPILADAVEYFMMVDTEDKARQSKHGMWTNPEGMPVMIDIHPIVGTKRHRFVSERVELRATNTMAGKAEVGDVTIVTENK